MRRNSNSPNNSHKMNSKDLESAQSLDLVDNRQQLLLGAEGKKLVCQQANNNNSSINKTSLANGHEEDSDEEQRFSTNKKHSASDSNNSNSNSSSKNHLKQTMTSFFCNKGRWFLLLSMTIVLIITAILVAMLTITLLDNEDTCFNSYPFQQPSYKLFSTKTSYSTTYNLLNNSGSPASAQNNGASSGPVGLASVGLSSHYDYTGVELPAIFSKSDSLRSIHERLVTRDLCQVRQFHYFGRHAARYPSNEDVEFINKQLNNVQNRIDLSKFSLNQQNNNKSTTTTTTSTSNNNTSTTSVCFNPLAQFKQWISFMTPEQGNLIMDSGLEETAQIAKRFRSIYPEMFDAELAKIELGTTEELRTAQTALAFLKQINNFKLGICDDDLDSFEPTTPPVQPQQQPVVSPIPAASSAVFLDGQQHQQQAQSSQDQFNENLVKTQRALELKSNQCFRQFLKKFHLDKLKLHKKCQTYSKEQLSLPYNLNLNEPNRTRFITNSVSKKLKLSKEDSLTPDETQAIYKICKYESALVGQSIWCNLFSDSDLKFYEYLSDVDDFFNQAYGHPDQMRSACPVTTDLMKAFKRIQQNQQQPEAHFYFTHSEVIQKILAASVDLENDPDFTLKEIERHLREGTTPESRQWRTSLYTPFSANLAFTLYECPRSSAFNKPSESTGYQIFDVSESPFKVVASLNEQPIQLDGCSGHICDLNELVKDSRIDREKRCKLEDICKVNRVYT